jgi:hypothetical protein
VITNKGDNMIDLDDKVMELKLELRALGVAKFGMGVCTQESIAVFSKHNFKRRAVDSDGNILISYQVALINHKPMEAFFRSFDDGGMLEFQYTGTEKYPDRPPRNY